MPKGYWVVSVDITDPDAYPRYKAANQPAFEKYGAKFLARGGRHTAPEVPVGARNVIIEFESYEAALACYDSPEYQEALQVRRAAATSSYCVILEGVS